MSTVLDHRKDRLATSRQLVPVQDELRNPVGKRTLEDLIRDINGSHELVLVGLATALREAIAAGEALLEAQRLVPNGTFTQWVEDNITVTRPVAYTYMRLAEFQSLLPQEFVHPTIERRPDGKYTTTGTIEKAIAYLQAIGAKRTQRTTRTTDYDEIKRLHRAGLSNKDIAALLNRHPETVRMALMPARERQAITARRKKVYRDKERAHRRQKQHEAIKMTKGDIAEAYSLLRRCLQHAQAAYEAMPSGKARRTLKGSITHLYEAEDAFGRTITDAEAVVVQT